MHSKILALAGAVAFLAVAAVPAAAAPDCCDHKKGAACEMKGGCDLPCCKHAKDASEPSESAVEIFMAMDPGMPPAVPARQMAVVWFQRPVLVGKSILLGRYVIEHDADRMARGEPCTHIYAYDNQHTPVAAFQCTHLEGKPATKNIVLLSTKADGMQRLEEFQFAGETAAHGVPNIR